MSTGNMRPAESTTGAPPSRSDTGPGSRVADMAMTRRSSRSAVQRLAHQGKGEIGLEAALVQLVEDHAADAVERRIVLQHPRNRPSVTTSMRVRGSDLGVEPHAIAHGLADLLRPEVTAMRRAAARAASRRGSCMTILPPPSHGASSSASGTRGRLAGARRRHKRRRRYRPSAPLSDAAVLRRQEAGVHCGGLAQHSHMRAARSRQGGGG